jgi:hypothetical protein
LQAFTKICCVAFAEPVWQQNPAPISLCAGQAQSRISLPRYLAFTNQLPETLLAENLLQKRLFDTGIETLPAPLKGRLNGAFSMCVSMSDKPFDAEACYIGGQASRQTV